MQRDYGHYSSPHCGGLQNSSGKGHGARDHKMRHQKAFAYPAWVEGKSGRGNKIGPDKRTNIGVDVYFSSRWDNNEQIYDHFHSPKTVSDWWETKSWEYVFIQEVAYSLILDDFDWSAAKSLPSNNKLRQIRQSQYWEYRKSSRRAAALRQRSTTSQ